MTMPITSMLVLFLVSALNIYIYAIERHAGRSGAKNLAITVLCVGVALMDATICIVKAIYSIS